MSRGKKVDGETIFAILKESAACVRVSKILRKYHISEGALYMWKGKYDGMSLKQIKKVMKLKEDNQRLKIIEKIQTVNIKALKSVISQCALKTQQKREFISQIIKNFGISARRASKLMGISDATYIYKPKVKPDEEIIRRRLRELAEERKRFGFERLCALLKEEGFKIGFHRTRRIYKEEGLQLPLYKRKQKTTSHMRVPIQKPKYPNHIWCMDFLWDKLPNKRRIKIFAIIDAYTRKCFRIEADRRINSVAVTKILNKIVKAEGKPKIILCDNCGEFHSNSVDEWAYQKGVKLKFIHPGKFYENMYIESFNARLREECLHENWFSTIRQTNRIVEKWRIDYNKKRPKRSLGFLSPEEFIRREKEKSSKEVRKK